MCALPPGQEALRKIITTLAVKNEEIQSFIYSLKQMLLNMEVRAGDGREGGGSPVSEPVAADNRGTLGPAAMSRPQFPHLSMGFGQSWLLRPATSLQGELGQGAGRPGGGVPVPFLPPGGAEGGDAHEDKAGPCQPNLRAAGVCLGGLSKTPDAISTARLRSQLASCLFPNLPLFLCPFLEMLPCAQCPEPDTLMMLDSPPLSLVQGMLQRLSPPWP